MELDNRLSGRLQNNNDHDMRVTNYIYHNQRPAILLFENSVFEIRTIY